MRIFERAFPPLDLLRRLPIDEDWLIIWRGEIVFCELKSPGGIASKIQRKVRDELLVAGVKWCGWRDPRALA
jgi:hypothetical protein